MVGKPYGSHQLLKFKTGPVFVAVGSGLSVPGYTLVADESVAGDLYALLASKVNWWGGGGGGGGQPNMLSRGG